VIASSIPAAATGGLAACQLSQPNDVQVLKFTYGTNIAEAVAPVSLTASDTFLNTGLPRCVSPAFFGFVPPTTFVPGLYQPYSNYGRVVAGTIREYHIRWLVARENYEK